MSSHVERPRFSCALAGAMTTVTALPRGIPVLHAAPGCAGNAAWTQLGGGGLQTGGYCGTLSVPSSNIQETEVVFGGVDRLREQLRHTLDIMDGDLFVVITGCVPAMIGDDVASVVNEFKGRRKKVLLAETSGFKGNSYLGYNQVLEAIFRDFVDPATHHSPDRVNLWGIVPTWDPFWRGNLAGVRHLLEQLGLKVNSFFGAQDTITGIRRAARSALNLVVSDSYGVAAAKVFEAVHGTPFLQLPLPIGPTASASFMREVGRALDLPSSRVDRVIEGEQRSYYAHAQSLADVYSDLDLQRYAVVVGDANYGVSVPRFLANDLGWIPELVVHTDPTEDGLQDVLRKRHAELPANIRPTVAFETDTSQIQAHVDALRPAPGAGIYHDPLSPAFVVGSSLDRPLATKLGAGHLSLSFPVANRAILDRGYSGFSGGLRLTEDLLSTIVAGR